MRSALLSSPFTTGVGRRIMILFLVAGLLPVLFTAYLAFSEVNRGVKQEVHNSLRSDAKAYGVDILNRLTDASSKASQIVSSVENNQPLDSALNTYLFEDFEAIWIQNATGIEMRLFGSSYFDVSFDKVDLPHLANGDSQLIPVSIDGKHDIVLAQLITAGDFAKRLMLFDLKAEAIWGPSENLPYMTEFCVFAASGESLFASGEFAVILTDGTELTLSRR